MTLAFSKRGRKSSTDVKSDNGNKSASLSPVKQNALHDWLTGNLTTAKHMKTQNCYYISYLTVIHGIRSDKAGMTQ